MRSISTSHTLFTHTHTQPHTLSVSLPDQHHFLSIQQTPWGGRRQIQTDRERRKWKKGFWMERGLDTTIFCPAGVDMHGQSNRLRRARQGGTLHTSGVRERRSVCVCVFSHVCAGLRCVRQGGQAGLQHVQSPSIQHRALCVTLKPLKMPPGRIRSSGRV